MIFHAFTVSAFGHCANREQFDSVKLSHDAVQYMAALLDQHKDQFQASMPLKGVGKIDIRWNAVHHSCALATFYLEGEMLTTEVLLSGLSAEADRKALETTQSAVENFCVAVGEEANDDLLRIEDRPAAISVRWTTHDRKSIDLVVDMEMCLAAAFLQRVHRSSESPP